MIKYRLQGKWLVVSSIALVIAIMGAGGYYSQHKLDKQGSPKVVQAVQIKKDPVIKDSVKKDSTKKVVAIKQNSSTEGISDSELAVYNTMHKMINTKIVAEDGKIWGEDVITTDKCNELVNEITDSAYPDKVTLLQFLSRWKDNNFASGVNEHNYLWDELNGTIGKAKSLRP
ncbi:DUF6241 domain-containing protein [Clostridium algoriphilum]|uniref:DUF6241 domain-containing protein n=1 Tax=Clostridium algoriphilum TaxID=198347 RepID=UPI001CF15BE8|nr:DUF6241 domain-containing protein [Clostridium algoriphilum]MCB2293536.1 DUF6241 domain-containing protein [Clostridium algoriphilum]